MRLCALLVSLFVLGACGGSTSINGLSQPSDGTSVPRGGDAPDGGGLPDASTPPPDGGTLDAGIPDAGAPDAGTPDAGTPDGGPVTKPPPQWPTLQTSIPTWHLRLSPENLQALNEHVADRDYLVPGRFIADGHTYEVQLRYRGRHTRFLPKKPWQVRFPKEDRFQTQKRLELLAAYKDGGYLTEKLWYDLGSRLGLKLPRVRYVHLYVNDRYEGVYTDVESIDKPFLEGHGYDDDGDVYRCGMHDCEMRQPPQEHYQEAWSKRTNEEQPWDRLWAFMDKINRTPPHEFRAFVERELALDDYLTWLALDAFIANDVQGDSRSYLVFDRRLGRWFYVPWDLNNARSLYNRTNAVKQGVKDTHPLLSYTPYDPRVYELAAERAQWEDMRDMKPTWSTLTTRIMDDEVLRARYVAKLRALLDTEFTEAVIVPRIHAMHALLSPFILPDKDGKVRDPYVSVEHARQSAAYLREYVHERREYLQAQLSALEAHGRGPLVIDRVGRDASGAFWVQLYNRGNAPVSLNGLYLSGFTRMPTQSRLPALTVPPHGFVTLREGGAGAEALGARLDPQRPEVALYESNGTRALDMLWLAPLKPGEAYGRQPRGAETFSGQPGP